MSLSTCSLALLTHSLTLPPSPWVVSWALLGWVGRWVAPALLRPEVWEKQAGGLRAAPVHGATHIT